MLEYSKIKVLIGLPYALSKDKDLRKAMETFIFLKHFHSNGTIWNYSSRAGEMAEECNISIRTFWTRLNTLSGYKLIRKRSGNLSLASWDDVMKMFKIQKKDFYFTRAEKYNSKRRLEYFLETKALQEKKAEMKSAFTRKFNKYSDLRHFIISNVGVNNLEQVIEALFDLQLLNFMLRKNAEKYNFLQVLNPDFNLNVESLAFFFDERKSKNSGTYTKHKLWGYGFINVERRVLKSNKRARYSALGTVRYNRKTKQTFLHLPDNIIIL